MKKGAVKNSRNKIRIHQLLQQLPYSNKNKTDSARKTKSVCCLKLNYSTLGSFFVLPAQSGAVHRHFKSSFFVLCLFQQRNNIFGYNLKALGVQVQTVIAVFFCKPALFVGQHFCKVEPLHLTVKSDFVQFLVDCQNLFVTAFADHLPCND